MKKTLAIIFLVFSAVAHAAPPIIVDGQTGKYLGNLSANPYDQDSVNNPFGRYGSQYSNDSINNQFGKYGSPYSNSSPNNPYSNNAPVIIHQDHGYDY